MNWKNNLLTATLLAFILLGCQEEGIDQGFSPSEPSSTDSSTDNGNTASGDLPASFQNFTNIEDIYVDGNYVVIQTKNVPDHNSPYFNTSDARYEAYNGSNANFHLNPNRISEQSYTFRIPLNPQASTTNQATALGAIGVSVNGISIFNQYAGPNNQALTNEINSFDQYNGHPQNTGVYHYHVEPLYLSEKNGKEALVGFLLDGFPVYGPVENAQRITNDDLDEFHGHFGATEEYPDGIYHYHITDEDPYINGSGYFGTPGSVSR